MYGPFPPVRTWSDLVSFVGPLWSVEQILAGDEEAAQALVEDVSQFRLGAVALFLYQQRLPRPVFAAFLAEAWGKAWRPLVDWAGDRRTLVRWFRYAQLSVPEHLPETVRVWRGTAGIDADAARRGLSWSLDRDVACWFAHWLESKGPPLVIMAEVPKGEILMYNNDRDESEVVLARVPTSVVVDGDIDDWRAGYERREKQNNEPLTEECRPVLAENDRF
ncbi:MAG: hypothetical protein AB7E55_17860 [Pigmentiphaga sp.]